MIKTLVLAVIGPHGAGKTSFIHSVTDCEPVTLPQSPALIEDGHIRYEPPGVPEVSLHRCNFPPGQTPFILVDTPGLCARPHNIPDCETIDLVKARLDRAGVRLHGVIYLQCIMEATSADFAVRNLGRFREVFQSDEFRHVVVATTFWDVSPKLEPKSDEFFLGEFRRLGASMQMEHQTARLYNDLHSSAALLESIRRASTFYPFWILEPGDEPVADSPESGEGILVNSKCCTM
ncbi:uncharacterized protein LY79DRAFT_558949 [Colletotrichum navitas]|uniref:G domain-containing protein n=1 Tax=Colletotrichum navitas TaxID=681940 RepID=A0AAD8V306_9PEZI|nr:uncharacterized protein LY79DRAFT_558949 [Colletotrichum navitas]KAK1585368.1 hypothetical protein LY79DRAFT_558949 [Colletotrichum navitas]